MIQIGTAVLILGTGCQSRQDRLRDQFEVMERTSYSAYVQAATVDASIAECTKYLTEVENFRQRGFTGVRYDQVRYLVEARLSEMYANKGDEAKAAEFMNLALAHSGISNATPSLLIEYEQRIDASHRPKWRMTESANQTAQSTSRERAETGH